MFCRTVVFILVTLFATLLWADDSAERPGCDSCNFSINAIKKPVSLAGKWLFTRQDDLTNKDPGIDESDWKLVKAPGPWKGVYDDGKSFRVGWYRAHLKFDKSLIGTEAVFLLDTYIAETTVYVDGVEVYHRGDSHSTERYYAVQPIPVRFKITKPEHLLAIRVDTIIMSGIYQMPLELKEYNDYDLELALRQYWGGETRLWIAYVSLFFGMFFFLVYQKTEYRLYQVAALACFVVFPFLFFPSDNLIKIFPPETLLVLHYFGLYSCFMFFLFSQFFYKFMPRVNWILGSIYGALAVSFIVQAFTGVNLEVFQKIRGLFFVLTLVTSLFLLYQCVRAVKAKVPSSKILLLGSLGLTAGGLHDFLLAFGLIDSFGMIFTGVVFMLGCILWISSNKFADTFVENKTLLKQLREINENLENLVQERTAQLRQKTHDIQSMLQNLDQGLFSITTDGTIHHEYSAHLERIMETTDIAGRSYFEFLFTDTDITSDALDGLETSVVACLGEDSVNFDFNVDMLIREYRKTVNNKEKILELSWNAIVNDDDEIEKLLVSMRDVTELKSLEAEAAAQKRELEIIGQILAISQEKFHDFIYNTLDFLDQNEQLITATESVDDNVIATLFRNMHTAKGNARTYGFTYLTNQAHDTESEYDTLRKNPETAVWDKDHLLLMIERTRDFVKEYEEINNVKLGRRGPGRRGNVERYVMAEKVAIDRLVQASQSLDREKLDELQRFVKQVDSTLHAIGTERLTSVLSGVIDSVAGLANELGKPAPKVRVEDSGVLIKNQIVGLLKNCFTHIFRNSIDHGIESATERQQKGKSPHGHILLTAKLDEQWLSLSYQDDGRGLALQRIRQKAIENEVIADADTLSAAQIANLIFHSGFSTAEKISEVSGRGVGMDAVKEFVKRENGNITIEFLESNVDAGADYVPFIIVIRFPSSMGVVI